MGILRLSHVDVERHEAKRKSKRSTWVDIADEGSEGAHGCPRRQTLGVLPDVFERGVVPRGLVVGHRGPL